MGYGYGGDDDDDARTRECVCTRKHAVSTCDLFCEQVNRTRCSAKSGRGGR